MPVRGKIGRPRRRENRLIADRGYDNDTYGRERRLRGVKPVIAAPPDRVQTAWARSAGAWPIRAVPPRA